MKQIIALSLLLSSSALAKSSDFRWLRAPNGASFCAEYVGNRFFGVASYDQCGRVVSKWRRLKDGRYVCAQYASQGGYIGLADPTQCGPSHYAPKVLPGGGSVCIEYSETGEFVTFVNDSLCQ